MDAPLRGLLAALFLPALLAVSAIMVPAAVAGSGVVRAENGSQPQRLTVRSHGYYRTVSVHNLQWAGWGQATAVAHGTFTFQFCVHESCSVSPFYDEPAAIFLTQVKRCGGRPFYTVLKFNVEGPLPDQTFKTYRTSLGACRPQSSGGRRKHG